MTTTPKMYSEGHSYRRKSIVLAERCNMRERGWKLQRRQHHDDALHYTIEPIPKHLKARRQWQRLKSRNEGNSNKDVLHSTIKVTTKHLKGRQQWHRYSTEDDSNDNALHFSQEELLFWSCKEGNNDQDALHSTFRANHVNNNRTETARKR